MGMQKSERSGVATENWFEVVLTSGKERRVRRVLRDTVPIGTRGFARDRDGRFW